MASSEDVNAITRHWDLHLLFVAISVKAIHLDVVYDLNTVAFIAWDNLWHGVASPPVSGVIMAPTLWVYLVNSLTNRYWQGISPTFLHHRAFVGTSYRSEHLILDVSGNPLLRTWKSPQGDTKLTFEELMTILAQVQACLSSKPLALTMVGLQIQPNLR